MKLFLPSARATNWLLITVMSALGYALYMRYVAMENSAVGLACQGGLNTWLCFTRRITYHLVEYSVFGWIALALGAVNFIRPSLVLFGAGLAIAAIGLVLYTANLSGLAAALLILSLARRAPATA